MSRLIQVSVGPLATANAAIVVAAAAVPVAGPLTLVTTGGVVLDQPRRVIVTSTGADSALVFTITGTDGNNFPLTATVTGVTTTPVDAGVSFKTVTRVVSSGTTANLISVGTNTVADSRVIFLDPFGYAPTSIQVDVTGTVNYTVRQSLDDPNGVGGFGAPLGLQNVQWMNSSDSNVVAAVSTAQSNYSFIPNICKVVLNSGTGSINMTVIQSASPSI